jgi:hypothetical protein
MVQLFHGIPANKPENFGPITSRIERFENGRYEYIMAMKKLCLAVILSLLWFFSSHAEESNFSTKLSPKLRVFLKKHPQAFQTLSNACAEAFPKRAVQVFYFYSEDETVARASHYYPSESVVGIVLRENQEPLDEFISVLYEVLNSRSEARSEDLVRQAESGAISKADFVREMLKTEFTAAAKTHELLVNLKFIKRETAKSGLYTSALECPDRFEDYVAHLKQDTSPRDIIKEYEGKYDMLRK